MSTSLEISANIFTTISILLAGRNSIHTWWSGILGCILFGFLFYHTQLYADVVLQLFFVITSILGWWQWKSGIQERPLPITHASLPLLAWAVAAGIAATIVYGVLLHAFSDAYAPYFDSAILVFSIIAQLLLMQRKSETWVFWMLVNTIAVPLYASRDLTLTSVLYTAYWINAVISWRFWLAQISEGAIGTQSKSHEQAI
jgi:nicotinamide mononucleotide transporter